MAAALNARTGARHDTRIYLRADQAVDYGALMQVMGLLRAAGYLQVALVGLEDATGQAVGQAGEQVGP